MKKTYITKPIVGALAGCALLMLSPTVKASIDYLVSVNTSALISNPSGPFSLDFQLNDGGGTTANTALIHNFNFGGGAPSGTANLVGGASGNLSSSVSLSDGFPTEFFQEFVPGSQLSFEVTLSTNAENGLIPDSFVFGILDKDLSNIPSSRPDDALFFVNIGRTVDAETGSSSTPALSVNFSVPDSAGSLPAMALALVALAGFGRFTQLRTRQA